MFAVHVRVGRRERGWRRTSVHALHDLRRFGWIQGAVVGSGSPRTGMGRPGSSCGSLSAWLGLGRPGRTWGFRVVFCSHVPRLLSLFVSCSLFVVDVRMVTGDIINIIAGVVSCGQIRRRHAKPRSATTSFAKLSAIKRSRARSCTNCAPTLLYIFVSLHRNVFI